MTLAAVILDEDIPQHWKQARKNSQFPPERAVPLRSVEKEEQDLDYLKQTLIDQRMRFEEAKKETRASRVLSVLRSAGLVRKKRGRP